MRSTKRTWKALLAMLVLPAAAGLAVSACRDHTTAPTDHQAAPSPSPDAGAGAPPPEAPGAPGMKAYVDPETGKLTDKPPPGAEPVPGDVLTPPPTVVERPLPGGGSAIDMRKGADTAH